METAVAQPLKDALTEEQWVQHNARVAAEAEAHKQAQEAAERDRQLAAAEAAQQQAAEAAEALRQSTLTKVGDCLRVAVRMHAHSLVVSIGVQQFLWTSAPCSLAAPHQSMPVGGLLPVWFQ